MSKKEKTTELSIDKALHIVCMNLQKTCSSLNNGKCKMTKAKCVFQQTYA
jgi:hypothetical protein